MKEHRPLHRKIRASWVVCSALALLCGCQKTESVRIDLSPGYRGKVDIACATTPGDVVPIAVDPEGRSLNVACPHHPADLVIMRNGKRIDPEGPVDWPATGDGIPVAIRFSVR